MEMPMAAAMETLTEAATEKTSGKVEMATQRAAAMGSQTEGAMETLMAVATGPWMEAAMATLMAVAMETLTVAAMGSRTAVAMETWTEAAKEKTCERVEMVTPRAMAMG